MRFRRVTRLKGYGNCGTLRCGLQSLLHIIAACKQRWLAALQGCVGDADVPPRRLAHHCSLMARWHQRDSFAMPLTSLLEGHASTSSHQLAILAYCKHAHCFIIWCNGDMPE